MKLHSKYIVAALVIAALSAPSALADTLRPARESGAQDAVGTLVTPDSLRPARESGAQEVGGALVSPDTLRPVRESGSPEAASLAGTEVVRIVKSGGFDWGDAGIGAAGALGLAVLLVGAALVLRRRVQAGSGGAAATSLP